MAKTNKPAPKREHKRVSSSVARLCDSQQLDDRIRQVINTLGLAPKPETPAAPAGEGPVTGEPAAPPRVPRRPNMSHLAAMAALAGGPEGEPAPGPGGRRRMKLPQTKEEWAKLIATFAPADPTGDKGTYLLWITKQVLSRNLSFPEDLDKTKETLADFDKLKLKGGFKDDKNIMAYQSFADLFNVVQKNSTVKTKTDLAMEGAEVICEDDVTQITRDKDGKIIKETPLGRARVIKVTTPEAGAKLFRKKGANWCVKDPQYFNSGSYAPPYFMVELKGEKDDDFQPKFLHDRKSMSLKKADDTDAVLNDMKPYAKLLKCAGLLDDKRGLKYILGDNAARDNRPLAFISVLMSDDRDLIRQARAHITQQLHGQPLKR